MKILISSYLTCAIAQNKQNNENSILKRNFFDGTHFLLITFAQFGFQISKWLIQYSDLIFVCFLGRYTLLDFALQCTDLVFEKRYLLKELEITMT